MTTETLTLTDFLLARIAEDEAVAQAAIADDGGEDGGFEDAYPELIRPPSGVGIASGGFGEAAARMIATYAIPRRVLAKCEADRRIVAEHRLITDPSRLVKVWRDPTPGVACERCAGDALGDRPLEDIGPCDTLRFLALPYADHPDWREEWRA